MDSCSFVDLGHLHYQSPIVIFVLPMAIYHIGSFIHAYGVFVRRSHGSNFIVSILDPRKHISHILDRRHSLLTDCVVHNANDLEDLVS